MSYSNILPWLLDQDAPNLNEVSHLVSFRHVSNVWVALRGHGDASSTGTRGKREASGLGGECRGRIEDQRRKRDWGIGAGAWEAAGAGGRQSCSVNWMSIG